MYILYIYERIQNFSIIRFRLTSLFMNEIQTRVNNCINFILKSIRCFIHGVDEMLFSFLCCCICLFDLD